MDSPEKEPKSGRADQAEIAEVVEVFSTTLRYAVGNLYDVIMAPVSRSVYLYVVKCCWMDG